MILSFGCRVILHSPLTMKITPFWLEVPPQTIGYVPFLLPSPVPVSLLPCYLRVELLTSLIRPLHDLGVHRQGDHR